MRFGLVSEELATFKGNGTFRAPCESARHVCQSSSGRPHQGKTLRKQEEIAEWTESDYQSYLQVQAPTKRFLLEEEHRRVGVLWASFQQSVLAAYQRRQHVLNSKIQLWCGAIDELYKNGHGNANAKEEAFSGLVTCFVSQQQRIKDKLERIRATRLLQESKERQQQKTPSPPETQQRLAMDMQPREASEATKKASVVTPPKSGEFQRSTAERRFEEVAELSQPILESAARAEKMANAAVRDAMLKMRMNLNRRVGQIANSRRQVGNVVQELLKTLSEAWSRHGPDMLNYALLILAKRLIEQAEMQIRLHPPSAFPIAQVIIDVGQQQRALIPILLHLLMKRCPYAVPRYIPRQAGQSEREHRLASGYLLIDGALEDEQAYIERMSGILCLLGAIVQATPTLGGRSPFGIENGWLWLASVLNMPPRPVTPYMICSFLESSGYVMWQAYREAFIKLLQFVHNHYLAMMPPGCVAAKTRLELYLGAILQGPHPTVPPPEGYILLP